MQQAVCPLCGGALTLEPQAQPQVFCPHCQGDLEAVMNGRAVILKERRGCPAEEPQAVKLADLARKTQDPQKRYQLLTQALAQYPDSLALNRALLFHGRHHERNSRRIDFSVIKCYLLHPFEAPEAHSEAERQSYYEELFASPQLQKCMALSPDGASFYQAYLQELCAQYVEIFLKGSSRYMVSMFGIPLGRAEKNLSVPAARMIRAMEQEPLLTPAQREELIRAFRLGYEKALGSTACLDALLYD
ncbi:MAG: hypothetical protein IJ461_01115 [Clostridia bacterium]|nr:hypothetical protein [Clostridia bacterium]